MLRPCLVLSALVACGLAPALADTVQLKDKAAITGKVLAEKSDHIAVDIGFTVLVIPRSQIVTIVRDGNPAPAAKSRRGPNPAATPATAEQDRQELSVRAALRTHFQKHSSGLHTGM